MTPDIPAELEGSAGDTGAAFLPPRLSVVFVARGSFVNVRKTLECLLGQSAASRIEFIFSTDSPALLREVEVFVWEKGIFASARFLLQEEKSIARARRLSAMEARAEVVAFVEDHGFPSQNWAEELLAAFESSENIDAAAPVMENPNQESAISRAQFLLFHGVHERRIGSCRFLDNRSLPWHSTAYRRSQLLAEVREVGAFEVEAFLLENIRKANPGARFVLCTQCSVQHVNMTLWVPALRHAFHGGRVFGAERCRWLGWNPWSRAARAASFPLIALLKIWHSASLLKDHASLSRRLATFATMFPLASLHALGEAWGTCFGKGRSPEIFIDFEVDRRPRMRPADWHHLLADSDQGATQSARISGVSERHNLCH
jgi:hypothetical protein